MAKNTTTTASVDFFKADRIMSDRVCRFMTCKVWRKAILLEYAEKLESITKSIAGLENLKGSIHEDKIDDMRKTYEEQYVDFINKRNDQLEKESTFELTENDKTFKKSVKTDVSKAVVDWFKAYNLDVENTDFLNEVVNAFGLKFDYKTLVDTNGSDARKLDVNRALEMLYATAYTRMLEVGTIKAVQIPEIVREKYTKKAKKSENVA